MPRFFDPRNVEKTTPAAMLEVREMLSIDGHKLWQEFTGYKSQVKTVPKLKSGYICTIGGCIP